MERTDRIALVVKTAEELEQLGTGRWEVVVDADSAYGARLRSGERVLWFTTPWNAKERVEVRGEFPRNSNGQTYVNSWSDGPEPSITIRADRGPVVLASEIEKRFLGPYGDLLAACLKRKAEDQDYEARRLASATRLAKVLGETYVPLKHGQPGEVRVPGKIAGYHKIIASADSATLELHAVPIEAAERILEILAETTGA